MKQPNLVTVAVNTHQAALFWSGDLWKGRTSHTITTPLGYSCEIGGADVTVPADSVHRRDEQFDVLSKRAVVEQATIQREGSNRQNLLAGWLPGSPAHKDRHSVRP